MRPVILVHGGAGSPRSLSDGCHAAAEAARRALESGDALAGAIAATVVLEDDPRLSAGTGSNLRFDGVTIEMDAAVVTSEAGFGAVACIQRVKNPVLVAARVMETPHLMLAGAGATAFARACGFPDHDPTTPAAHDRWERALAELAGHGDGSFGNEAIPWRNFDIPGAWNFGVPLPPGLSRGSDTVGAVVRDAHGHFAATASTGGTLYTLKGRVGDSPLLGCGVYAGPAGAVAATGVGEEIVRRLLAKTVYDWLAEGIPAARAAHRGVALFPDVVDVGLLVVDRTGYAVASNRDMASAEVTL